ncbi:hypothetical protein KIN20_007292 [Parelaphostrongylus tenuis]|nr:hypothetical protein KIN20_007292 [Parelaphostrongylus tenuis]
MIEAHRMALSYMNNQDLERALILLIRFCSFTLEELPKHNQFSQFDGEEKRTVLSLLKPAIERAENIKHSLRLKFEEEAAEVRKSMRPQQGHESANASVDRKSNRSSTSVPSDDSDALHIVDPGINTSGISFPGLNVPSSSSDITSVPSKHRETPSAPPVDRSDKPNNLFHSTCAAIGNRVVLVPDDLIKKFLICAEDNTMRNVETCGTLCGIIIGCELLISHVIIPKQTGASDGCFAEGEEEIFAYQDKHDLITLGWIHTHPSQTAFLSSVDLHTHCAYQIMLSEAIAIVCAPSQNQVGTFVLSPYGMSVVESCTKSGFHLHPDAEKLFLEAEHVKYSAGHSTTIVDMRHQYK